MEMRVAEKNEKKANSCSAAVNLAPKLSGGLSKNREKSIVPNTKLSHVRCVELKTFCRLETGI